eukprot:CAMPEP_0183384138 /NCGR_PEP_ID=MMETSP0370-20130417/274_1 /TAXON_ID=268820 /ORGANISM="Peridinium aciculiferum, Strain PAER-2" /LENGTH=32 /DNA_ID= /DNA_START= /DNA_END= /DNA_ORIENTATION=
MVVDVEHRGAVHMAQPDPNSTALAVPLHRGIL